MPKKKSGAQDRKRRAQFEAFLNESRKFMKKNFKSSGYAKRHSADIRRQDESVGTDNHRIVKHRGRKTFVCPGHRILSLRHCVPPPLWLNLGYTAAFKGGNFLNRPGQQKL